MNLSAAQNIAIFGIGYEFRTYTQESPTAVAKHRPTPHAFCFCALAKASWYCLITSIFIHVDTTLHPRTWSNGHSEGRHSYFLLNMVQWIENEKGNTKSKLIHRYLRFKVFTNAFCGYFAVCVAWVVTVKEEN